jgi:hypothetical protein
MSRSKEPTRWPFGETADESESHFTANRVPRRQLPISSPSALELVRDLLGIRVETTPGLRSVGQSSRLKLRALMLQMIIDDLVLVPRLLAALLPAGLVGWEREKKQRPAGLRTHMLVGVSACAFVIISELFVSSFDSEGTNTEYDPIRTVQATLAGVSFLGAGSIIVMGGARAGTHYGGLAPGSFRHRNDCGTGTLRSGAVVDRDRAVGDARLGVIVGLT